jgi:hypothetical protein
MKNEVYVTVKEDTHWPEGNNGAGAWLFPGETYSMCWDDADALAKARPHAGVELEDPAEHHEKSRAAAAKGGE